MLEILLSMLVILTILLGRCTYIAYKLQLLCNCLNNQCGIKIRLEKTSINDCEYTYSIKLPDHHIRIFDIKVLEIVLRYGVLNFLINGYYYIANNILDEISFALAKSFH